MGSEHWTQEPPAAGVRYWITRAPAGDRSWWRKPRTVTWTEADLKWWSQIVDDGIWRSIEPVPQPQPPPLPEK